MNWIDKAKDNRTDKRFKRDFYKGTKVERAVMVAFTTWYKAHGIDCYSEKIGEDVFLERHDEPDYYFYKPEQHTLEIKYTFTGKFKDNIIAIRPSVIYKMKNNEYPNGKVLVATPYEFSTIDVEKLDKCEYFKHWNKKCFQVNRDDLKWFNWVTPLVI